MGAATAILVGQVLGSNELHLAMDRARKLIAFSVFIAAMAGILLLIVSPFVPMAYRTEAHVRSLASGFLRVYACCMPLFGYANATYFTLRSGGKTMLTFVFDSGFTWALCVPLAWCLVHLTDMDVLLIYLCVQLLDIIKVFFGHYLIKKGVGINNMVV